MSYDSFDDRARELAARNTTTQYRPLTDESEDVSGDNIVYADESEWADGDEDCGTSVSDECAAGRCGNCWDDTCGCPMCGHPGA
jgi:hypothetical protein